MMYLNYGSKDWNLKAWEEISAGRPLVIQVFGTQRKFIYQLLLTYSERSQISNEGKMPKTTFFNLGWRSIFAPSMMGICVYARSSGMAMKVSDGGDVLEVKFQKPMK